MYDKRTPNKVKSSRKRSNSYPRSLNYYLNFSKARRKLGPVATKGYFQLKDFLVKEVSLPTASNILNKLVFFTEYKKSLNENKKENNNEEKEPEEDIDTIVKRANEVLAEATTVFPFTLFPDTVTVDRTKLTITQRTFFMSSQVITIHIEDVLNIAAQVGPLFGSLNIAIKGLTSKDHFAINYFWRKDAIHLKHVIQGHIIAQHDKLDYRHMEHDKLLETLVGLGRDSNP